MNELLKLSFSMFSIIAAGFLIVRLKIINESGEKALTDLVLSVILPCNVFCSFFAGNFENLAADCFWILMISVGVQVIALLYTRFVFRMQNKKQQCDLSYAMISPNTGFFGSPIAESIFGPVGLMLTCIYLIPQRLVMWSVGLSMFTGVSEKRTAVRKLITHPCVIACILGLLLMVLKLPFPDWILSPVRMIGRCNTPISMLVIGMIVSKVSLKALANKTVIMFSIHRLFVVPAIIFIVCCLLPVSRTVFGVSVLLAAMPAGATTSMLASKYDKDPVFAAELVVFSTICSIPAILAWMLFIS
jgi:predicted permease